MKTKYLIISSLILLVSVISGCGSQSYSKKALCDTINPKTAIIAPADRLGEKWWADRQAAVNERVKQGNVDILLLGDSITHGWDGVPELWAKYFGKWQTVNAGFSGDGTQHVLWRIENGNIAGISPKLCVIMIGTNNSNGNDNTAEEIADGIKTIICKLNTDIPQAKILLLAIFPRGDGPSAQREKNAKASLLASKMADNKTVFYLDINDKFLGANGILSKDIMPDMLHPNALGYTIWGDATAPTIEKLMK